MCIGCWECLSLAQGSCQTKFPEASLLALAQTLHSPSAASLPHFPTPLRAICFLLGPDKASC